MASRHEPRRLQETTIKVPRTDDTWLIIVLDHQMLIYVIALVASLCEWSPYSRVSLIGSSLYNFKMTEHGGNMTKTGDGSQYTDLWRQNKGYV